MVEAGKAFLQESAMTVNTMAAYMKVFGVCDGADLKDRKDRKPTQSP